MELVPDIHGYGEIRIQGETDFDGKKVFTTLASIPTKGAVGEPQYGNGYYLPFPEAMSNARRFAASEDMEYALRQTLKFLKNSDWLGYEADMLETLVEDTLERAKTGKT